MKTSLQEALKVSPEARHLYETSAPFKEAVDGIFACFDAAREQLSDEDYAEFLKYGIALGEEWA